MPPPPMPHADPAASLRGAALAAYAVRALRHQEADRPSAAPRAEQPAVPLLQRLPLAARFDLLVKFLYALHRLGRLPDWVTVDVPTLYRRHIQLRSGGVEPSDTQGKPTVQSCVEQFDALIDGMAAHGFDARWPAKLSAADGLPCDGAHRLATALALDLPAVIDTVPAPGWRWDLPWFQQHGFAAEDCNVLLRTWLRLRPGQATLALLWSPAEAQWPQIEAALAEEGAIVGTRTLELPREGFDEMVRDVYSVDGGPVPGAAIERKIDLLRAWPARLRLVWLERRTGGPTPAEIERRVRELFDAAVPASWFVTLHLGDTPAEMRHLAAIFANEHNLGLLRQRQALPAAFLSRLQDLQRALQQRGLQAEDACVVGGSVLAALGLRPSDDIDITLRHSLRHQHFDAGITRLADGVDLVTEGYARSFGPVPALTDDQLIDHPAAHFHVRGVRFAAPQVVRERKQHQGREKDLRDLPLLGAYGSQPVVLPTAPAVPAPPVEAVGDLRTLMQQRRHAEALDRWLAGLGPQGCDNGQADAGVRLLQAQLESADRCARALRERGGLAWALAVSRLRHLDPEAWSRVRTALGQDTGGDAALGLALEALDPSSPEHQHQLIDLLGRLRTADLCSLVRHPIAARNGALFQAAVQALLASPQAAWPAGLAFNVLALGSAVLTEPLFQACVQAVRSRGPAPTELAALAQPEAALRHIAWSHRLSGEAPAVRLSREPLRIALCLSGQMRGYADITDSWRHLGLDGHRVDLYLHTWRQRGQRLPDPQVLGSASRRFEPKAFCRAFLTAGQRHGLAAMKVAYPRLFKALEDGATVDAATLQFEFGADVHVVVEDEEDAAFRGWTVQQKMHYKIHAAHQACVQSGVAYDLILRMRPDQAFEPGGRTPDWHALRERSERERAVFCETAPALREDLVIGDRFAAGVPAVMAAYTGAWAFVPRARQHGWFAVPGEFLGHTSLAYACLYQGVRARAMPDLAFGALTDARRLRADELSALLAADLPAGPRTDMDRLLCESLGRGEA